LFPVAQGVILGEYEAKPLIEGHCDADLAGQKTNIWILIALFAYGNWSCIVELQETKYIRIFDERG
jgi:hypothetical protein